MNSHGCSASGAKEVPKVRQVLNLGNNTAKRRSTLAFVHSAREETLNMGLHRPRHRKLRHPYDLVPKLHLGTHLPRSCASPPAQRRRSANSPAPGFSSEAWERGQRSLF